MVMDILSSMEDSDEGEESEFFTKIFVSVGLKILNYILLNFVKIFVKIMQGLKCE